MYRQHGPPRDDGDDERARLPVRRIASAIAQEGIPFVVAVQILLAFISQGFLGFYPTYPLEIKGFSPQTAAILFGLYFAIGVLVQPLTGLSNDRFGPRATLLLLIGALFVGLLALLVAQTVVHVFLVTLLVSHRNGTGIVANTFIADALYEPLPNLSFGTDDVKPVLRDGRCRTCLPGSTTPNKSDIAHVPVWRETAGSRLRIGVGFADDDPPRCSSPRNDPPWLGDASVESRLRART